jgi:hypothetical protein
MKSWIVKIMAEILGILAIATKEVRQGWGSESLTVTMQILTWLMTLREIPEEVDQEDGYRKCTEKAGKNIMRRGSDGNCSSHESYGQYEQQSGTD